jgi:hypothetical protein
MEFLEEQIELDLICFKSVIQDILSKCISKKDRAPILLLQQSTKELCERLEKNGQLNKVGADAESSRLAYDLYRCQFDWCKLYEWFCFFVDYIIESSGYNLDLESDRLHIFSIYRKKYKKDKS